MTNETTQMQELNAYELTVENAVKLLRRCMDDDADQFVLIDDIAAFLREYDADDSQMEII